MRRIPGLLRPQLNSPTPADRAPAALQRAQSPAPWSRRATAAALALGLAIGLGGQPAAATVVVVPTLEEMTHRSDVIVHAVVRDITVIEEVPGRLVTKNTLEVQEGVRGAKAGERFVVRQLGGSLDGQVAWIAGQHHFKVGEEVVFFGVRPAVLKGEVVPYGIGFGIFRVEHDVDGAHLREIAGDVTAAVTGPDGKMSFTDVQPRHYDSLPAFFAHLRLVLEGQNARPLPQLRVLGPSLQRPDTHGPHGAPVTSSPATTSPATTSPATTPASQKGE